MEIHQFAVVHPDAKIGENVKIGPFVTIDANVEIGDGTIIDSPWSFLAGRCITPPIHLHLHMIIIPILSLSDSISLLTC